jgi:SAM-dependent methyltransferase
MNPTDIARRRDELTALHGPWTSHNIELAPGVWTRPGEGHDGHDRAFARLLRAVLGVTGKPAEELRVLDLACLEGYYSVAFARLGAEVVGIEGRESHRAKAQLAKEALGLDRLAFELDDVRNLSAEKYGTFDVVLAIGIMYHLDSPDAFRFAEAVFEVCKRVAVVETQVSLQPETSVVYKDRQYHGHFYQEHEPGTSEEERRASPWASLSDIRSFWPTRPSLYNVLGDAGFSTVLRLHAPGQLSDRDTLVCLRGGPPPAERWPEEGPPPPTNGPGLIGRIRSRLK